VLVHHPDKEQQITTCEVELWWFRHHSFQYTL
jgi:hypothetical protein